MKTFLSFFVMFMFLNTQCFSLDFREPQYLDENVELGGDAKIIERFETILENKYMTSFKIEVEESGEYSIYFWILPSKNARGILSTYLIRVNDNEIQESINTIKNDWHFATLKNNRKVLLKKGTNVISIHGTTSNYPNVEHIKLFKNLPKSALDGSAYEKFKSDIITNLKLSSKDSQLTFTNIDDTTNICRSQNYITRSGTSEDPLYNYEFYLNMTSYYTFYTKVNFQRGQEVNITTTGIDNFSHIIELFHSLNPENYSWSQFSSGNGSSNINLTIPQTGSYYVRVRSYNNARIGLCNLNINNENIYDSIPLYSIGVRCTQDIANIYNTFTCHSTGDPMILIEEGTSLVGQVYTFNNDYPEYYYYYWGKNARIKRNFLRPVHAVILSTATSYNPMSTFDLYVKCLNSDIMSPDFPFLNENEAIQSSPYSGIYNCISWSGGITSYWEWPLSLGSIYFNPDPLTSFDNFYHARGFTREGATYENSVIDLYEKTTNYGTPTYTHAAVRKGADNNAHGYDWESKPGNLMRTFHSRHSLEGDNYGQVTTHYIRNNSNSRTLEEEIADGTIVLEYIFYNSEEKDYINQKIEKIDKQIYQNFLSLYDKWGEITKQTPYSNPEQIAQCQEYTDLYNYCLSNHDLIYAIFDKLGKDHIIATGKLIDDLILKKNLEALQSFKERHNKNLSKNDVKIIRPLHSNYILYVKDFLSAENPRLATANKIKSSKTTDISFSNSTDFNLTTATNLCNINLTLPTKSKIQINLIDLNGNLISHYRETELNSGTHTIQIPTSKKGIHIVQLFVNGIVNIKKIHI